MQRKSTQHVFSYPAYAPYGIDGALMRTTTFKMHDVATDADIQDGSAPAEWRPNTPFYGTFVLDDVIRTRKSVFLTAHPVGRSELYPLFLTDLFDVLTHMDINAGKISGTWFVKKRGAYYGLAPYADEYSRLRAHSS